MTMGTLLSVGYTFIGTGFTLAIAGLLLSLLTKTGPGTDPEVTKKMPLVRLSIGIVFLGGFFLAIAIFVFLGAAGWWLFRDVIQLESPGQLAMYSLIIGPLPLVLPLSAEIITRILGGNVGAHGRSECFFRGIDIGPFLENLMMSYLLIYISAGLAMFGLLGSGIWRLIIAFG